MSHPWTHSLSSAKRFGGKPEDYMEIHNWFDFTKSYIADMRHRAMRHHAQGIFEVEKLFGHQIINSDGKAVMVRYIGEQHVIEDLGFIPTAQDWLNCMSQDKWMMNRNQVMKRKLEEPFSEEIPESVGAVISKQNME